MKTGLNSYTVSSLAHSRLGFESSLDGFGYDRSFCIKKVLLVKCNEHVAMTSSWKEPAWHQIS